LESLRDKGYKTNAHVLEKLRTTSTARFQLKRVKNDVMSTFGLGDAKILSICCSTGEFLSDFVTVIITVTPPDIGVAWLITLKGVGGKIDLGVRSQVRKRGEIGFDQSFNTHTPLSSTLIPILFHLPSFNSVATKNFLR
jgi:hypothetical protein